MIPLYDTVTVTRPGGTSWNGDPLPPTDYGPYPAAVNPLSSTEDDTYTSDQLIGRYQLILPAVLPGLGSADGDTTGPDLVGTDTIGWRGQTWQLDGNPRRYRVRGREHHQEATMLLVQG